MRHKRRHQEIEGLTPIVREALERLRPVPAPDSAAWEADRQAFLTQARAYSSEAVSTPPIERDVPLLSLWMLKLKLKLKKFLTISFKEAPMLAFVKVFLVLAVALGGSAGAAEATYNSLPGSPLYALKLQLEDWQLDLASQPATKAEVAMRLAERRLDEALALADREDEIPIEVAERYQAHLETALQATETITTPHRERIQARLAEQLQAMLEQLPEDVPEEAIAAMTQAMTTAQERVGAGGPPDEVGPPSDIPGDGEGPPDEAGPPKGKGEGEDDDEGDEDAGPPDDADPPEEAGPPSDIPGEGEDDDEGDEDAGPPDDVDPHSDIPGAGGDDDVDPPDDGEDAGPPDEIGPPDDDGPPDNPPGNGG